MKILDEFRQIHKFYEKKYKNQAVFKSMRMVKNKSGELEPVFYIGVPGLMVALAFAIVILATVYIVSLPFKWYIWVPYALIVIFGFRIALKLDKVKQVRYMVSHQLDMSLKFLEKAANEKDKEARQSHLQEAEEWLRKTSEWVDEPAIEAQLEQIIKS
ncbi:MAG: hypothetical protein AB7E76_13595 [Deferribacterales bacterium]